MSGAPPIERYCSSATEGGSGRAGGDVSAAVRSYLTDTRAFLRELHASGASGRDVNEAHSDQIDRMVRQLFRLAENRYFTGGGSDPSELCVVAVGGYARREMSIYSDVDILFLYRDELTPYVSAITEQMQYWLWDAQVIVGGATRNITETIAIAREDHTVCTSVLAPRFIVGSGVLFHGFNDLLRRELLANPEVLTGEILDRMNARHAQFGDSLYLLQPNVKESAGGLRDYHASYWAMQVSQSSARGKNDFLHLGLLTEHEANAYFSALDFLWRIRNEIHLISGRKNDQMSFDIQEKIAATFEYVQGESAVGDLPVERFMRDYYIHARDVLNHSLLVIEQCLARVRQAPRKSHGVDAGGNFRLVDGRLEIPHERTLRDDPVKILEVFAVAQEHDVALTRKAQRLVRENLDLVDDEFRQKPEAVAAFVRILEAKQRVTRTLITMNEIGLLARFLPEWEHIVCRWQHVMYHTYTVDVHSIFLVEELRRLMKGDYDDELPDVAELSRGVDEVTVLFLGCLFHDIGKGLGGEHSAKGAARARACLVRMGMGEEVIARVVFLVEHHLLMSHIAQRRDLSDPKLILEFARTVVDRTNLRNLYLLTVADIRASSKTAWTDWKGRLLKELFERTSEFLETGANSAGQAVELIERRVETRRAAATAELARQGIDEAMIGQYFGMMPRRYFTAHAPSQIARHARVVFAYEPEKLISTAWRQARENFVEFILCTRDVHGLYSNVAGVLTAHHMNILGAHAYTSTSGLALEVYRLSSLKGGEEEREIAWAGVDKSLVRVLRGDVTVSELRKRRGAPLGRRVSPMPLPVRVSITNDESDFYTIIDVTANDRLGLLHDLTRVLASHGCAIYISKAGSVLDQVTDTFYIKDQNERKLHDDAAIEALRRDLLRAAEAGESDAVS